MARQPQEGLDQWPLPPGSRLGPRWRRAAWQGRTAVGIDLGGGSLRLAQVSWGRQGARLETFAWVPLPWGTVEEGVVLRPAEVASTIRSVYRVLGLRQRGVVACAGGPGVLTRPVSFPPMPLAEVREAMRYEAAQYLPIPADQLVYDVAVLPPPQPGPDGPVPVLLAGTSRRLAESFMAVGAGAGVCLQALDVDCLCALRTLAATGVLRAAPQEALVLLDGGETGLALTIFRSEVPVLTRTIPVGMAELRSAVSEGMDVSLAEAQARIWCEGLNPAGAVGALADAWIRTAAEAVGRSLEFFLIQNRELTVRGVCLSGPWAGLPHLAPTLRNLLLEAIGDHLDHREPFRVQVVDLAGFPGAEAAGVLAAGAGPALLGALGAALRGVPTR